MASQSGLPVVRATAYRAGGEELAPARQAGTEEQALRSSLPVVHATVHLAAEGGGEAPARARPVRPGRAPRAVPPAVQATAWPAGRMSRRGDSDEHGPAPAHRYHPG